MDAVAPDGSGALVILGRDGTETSCRLGLPMSQVGEPAVAGFEALPLSTPFLERVDVQPGSVLQRGKCLIPVVHLAKVRV